MKKLVLIMILFAAFFSAVYAKSFKGWKQYKTEHFTFVFEEQDKSAVEELLLFAEEDYQRITGFLQSNPGRVTVIINGRWEIPNGMTFAGFVIHLHTNPAWDTLFGSRMEGWLRFVLIHELTHEVHLSPDTGVGAVVEKVFGPFVSLMAARINLPGWAIEGITVNLETMFTLGGRGRNPFFELLYKAPILENNLFSLKEAGTSSLDPPANRIYVSGYVFVRYLMDRFGEDIFTRLNADYNKHWNWDKAVETVTGYKVEDLWYDLRIYLTEKYASFRDIPEGERISPRTKGVNWYIPQKTEKGFYMYRTTKEERMGIINFDPETGKAVPLADALLANENGITADTSGKWIVWGGVDANMGKSAIMGMEIDSDLFVFNTEKGEKKRLTEKQHLSDPALSPDGKHLVAVQTLGSHSRLVQVDMNSGKPRVLFSLRQSQISSPAFSPDGKRVVFCLNTRGMQDIWITPFSTTGPEADGDRAGRIERIEDFTPEEAAPLFTRDFAGDYFPSFADEQRIVFTSDRSGSLKIYQYDLDARSLTLIADDPVGAFGGLFYKDDFYYSSYSSHGYTLKKKKQAELLNQAVIYETETPPPLLIIPEITGYSNYVFLPRPVMQFPYLIPTETNGAIGVSTGLFGYFLSRDLNQIMSGQAGWDFLNNQPELSLSYANEGGPLWSLLGLSQKYSYHDATGQYRQKTSVTGGLIFPLINENYPLATGFSIECLLDYNFRASSSEGFTFSDSFNAAGLTYDNELDLITGLQFIHLVQGPPVRLFDQWFAFNLIANIPLPVFGPREGLLLNSSLQYRHDLAECLKLDLSLGTSYTTADYSYYTPATPRGFTYVPGDSSGAVVLTTDLSLSFSGLSFYTSLQGNAGYNMSTPDFTLDPYLFAGMGLKADLPFPLEIGINARISPQEPASFDLSRDFKIYLKVLSTQAIF